MLLTGTCSGRHDGLWQRLCGTCWPCSPVIRVCSQLCVCCLCSNNCGVHFLRVFVVVLRSFAAWSKKRAGQVVFSTNAAACERAERTQSKDCYASVEGGHPVYGEMITFSGGCAETRVLHFYSLQRYRFLPAHFILAPNVDPVSRLSAGLLQELLLGLSMLLLFYSLVGSLR